ncbi:MAG: MinD/ParA family protein [Terriglobia bacterium]
MLDQATILREIVNRATPEDLEYAAPKAQPVAIAITSGKGGVGKTNVVANLAISLANLGKRVMILDADLGLGNIDVLLGLVPRYNLADFVFGNTSLEEIVIEGPSGVKIIPASSGIEQMTALTPDQQMSLIRGISRLGAEADYLLIDTAAGISGNVINFLLASGLVIIVTSPDPTSIVDAYLMVKILAHRESQKRVSILVNSVSGQEEAKNVFQQLDAVSRQFLNKPLELFGFVQRDKNFEQAVRQQVPFVHRFPDSVASRNIQGLAKKLHTLCYPESQQTDEEFTREHGHEDVKPS